MNTLKYDIGLSRRISGHLGFLAGTTTAVFFAAPLLKGPDHPKLVMVLLAGAVLSGLLLAAGGLLLFRNKGLLLYSLGCVGCAVPWMWAAAERLWTTVEYATGPLPFLIPVVLLLAMLVGAWAARK